MDQPSASTLKSDEDLCTATYPDGFPDSGQLCDQPVGHAGDHRALTEIAFNYRRHHVWSPSGEVRPDLEVKP